MGAGVTRQARLFKLSSLDAPFLDREIVWKTNMGNLEEAGRRVAHDLRAASGDNLDDANWLNYLGNQLFIRYKRTGAISDLEKSIRVAQRALLVTPEDDPEYIGLLYRLGIQIGWRYHEIGEIDDSEETIRIMRIAIDKISVGIALRIKFLRTRDIADLEEAIQATRDAINEISHDNPIYEIPRDSPIYFNWLYALADQLDDKYDITKALPDLQETIKFTLQAVSKTPRGHSAYAEGLHSLGIRFRARYLRTKELDDVEEGIDFMQEAISSTPEDDPQRAKRLRTLATLLGDRYDKERDVADLEEAIRLLRLATDMTTEYDLDYAGLLNDLSKGLRVLFFRAGNMADLEGAIQASRQAVNMGPEDHSERATWLINLGRGLHARATKTEEIAHVDEAIQVVRQAIDLTSEGSPDLPKWLHDLGKGLRLRYLRTNALEDIGEAINVLREASKSFPSEDISYTEFLNNLGMSLSERGLRTGTVSDLNETIQVLQQALKITPEDNTDHPVLLSNLADVIYERYVQTEAMVDLEGYIQLTQRALNVVPEHSPDRPRWLNRVGVGLGDRYQRTRLTADLDMAIDFIRQAVNTSQEDHLLWGEWLNNLAVRLGNRYSINGDIADLEEAIKASQEVISITPEDHPNYPRWLNNLGNRLLERYLYDGVVADLDKSIDLRRQAIAITPKDHPDNGGLLMNYVDALMAKLSLESNVDDTDKMISNCESALRQSSFYIDDRIRAGDRLLDLYSMTEKWDRAFEASELVNSLIPRLTSRHLENADRQHRLRQAVGLASDTAAVAMHAKKSPLTALDFLENGRGVLATSLEDMRIDIVELQEKYPDLAEPFIALRDELEKPPSRANSSTKQQDTKMQDDQSSWRAEATQRHDTGDKLNQLIIEIRKRPGFEQFLLPPSELDIHAAASQGPIVVINVSKHRCDAIIVESQRIRSLRLNGLERDDIEEKSRRGSLGTPEILEWLWDFIAGPVLDALTFTQPPPDKDWPHVWWIPTGPLSKFPLHAAGRHEESSGDTVLDRVMSSYSPSIKAIINGRRRSDQMAPQMGSSLLVSMERTPGYSILPYATDEIEMLHDLHKSLALNPLEPGRCYQDIRSHLADCRIFHFAGHGLSHPDDPSKSELLVEDRGTNPLTVATLLEMNLRQNPPFLAYLSACGTGRIRDESFVDESIHLISAFQLAGFRHVIGTLWEVNDEMCVDIARLTYEGIRDGGMTDDSVCRGLHHASRELRDLWLISSAIRGRRLKNEAGPLPAGDGAATEEENERGHRLGRDITLDERAEAHWIPYVHFGV
ncbi:unnamed protein product [Clonostachys rosea f. rosea IK726]|uniref:Uncharacterized protein n=1 Tax=Clonostachys rosea f. rosea IK726 TaxID=1349383 RepID=A0ACA9UEI1_BIOOC|nr:unnamed protein product [Clonostachys rosea f. rosea IK726]